MPGLSTFAAPTIATGRSGAPVVSARRAAPRCHGRSAGPSTVPCGKTTTAAPLGQCPAGGRDRRQVAAGALDGDPTEFVEEASDEPIPPQLALREEAERTVERRTEEERVGERVVVRHDHDRPTGTPPAPSTSSRPNARTTGETDVRSTP